MAASVVVADGYEQILGSEHLRWAETFLENTDLAWERTVPVERHVVVTGMVPAVVVNMALVVDSDPGHFADQAVEMDCYYCYYYGCCCGCYCG